MRTNRQTDRHANCNTLHPTGDEVKTVTNHGNTAVTDDINVSSSSSGNCHEDQ